MDTDASYNCIGAVLSQVQDNEGKVIFHASHVLLKPHRKYCTTIKELLVVVKFCRHFRHYLLGRRFTLRTDHNRLVWFMRFKYIEGQLARWLEELAQFDMEIIHRPGKLHGNSDGMSRIPDTLIECDCYSAGAELEKLPCGGCRYCTRAHNQWAIFDADVDDVIPLSKKVSVTTVVPKQEIREDPSFEASRLVEEEGLEQEIRASQSMHPDHTRSDNSQEQDESTLQSEVDLDATWPYIENEDDPDTTKPYGENEGLTFNNLLPEYSFMELRQIQEEDNDISPIIQWLETGEDPSMATLRLSSPVTRFLWLGQFCLEFHNNFLFYKYFDRIDKELCLVVPEKLKNEILKHCHDDKVAGHLGKDKTIQRIKQYFIWHQMGSDITNYVLTCNICNRYKNDHVNPDMLYKLIMLGLQWKDCILIYWDLLIKVMTKTVVFL